MTDAGSPLNRAFQRKLLLSMRAVYPAWMHEVPDYAVDTAIFSANVAYLAEHRLCESKQLRNMGSDFDWIESKITARGMDFLEDDGGLSAILGVVTVKLHAETIRDLICEKIDAAAAPDAEKSALKKAVANLPEAALGEVIKYLVKAGLDHLPNVAGWLHTFIIG